MQRTASGAEANAGIPRPVRAVGRAVGMTDGRGTAPTSLTGVVVLVTGWDPDARSICDAYLRHCGCTVVTVHDIDSVPAVAEHLQPHVVITMYPTRLRCGRTVAGAIRTHADLGATPVLSLAACELPDVLADARGDGVTESLPMPVDFDALASAVRRLAARAPA